MATRKALPELIDFVGGLNTKSNPLTLKPNEWTAAQNVFVGKPYGFKTGTVEENHVAQTRPPMRLFFNSPFDIAVAGAPTEVKPLVGATQAAQDNQPTQWQTIAKVTTGEGFASVGASCVFTLSETTPLTQSDGDNQALKIVYTSGGHNGVSADSSNISATLVSPSTKGNIGNNSTLLYIDYVQTYATNNVNVVGVSNIRLRMGKDSSNYLEYIIPVQAPTLNVTPLRFTNRYSVNIRSFDSQTGTLSFGELIGNIQYVNIFFQATNLQAATGGDQLLIVDHVRLDVDYLGFFGDFTSGQPYKQISLTSFDPTFFIQGQTFGYNNGFYPERRLSIGNGSVATEGKSTIGGSSVGVTYSTPLAIVPFSSPMCILLDCRIENFPMGSTASLILVDSAFGSSTYNIASQLAAISGDGVVKIQLTALDSYFSLLNIKTITLAISASSTSMKAYFSNLRIAPYTIGSGFAVQSGNIRDSFLYDPTDIGQSSRFLTSCGDALFIGTSLLSSNSLYVEGGFTNWSQSNPNLPQRFVFAMVTNPNFIASQTFGSPASQGDTSITLAGLPTNLAIGEQVVIDPNGVFPEINYVASTYTPGSVTVPLKTALAQAHASGATVTWQNTAQPKNQVLLVNGVDGLYSVDIFTYPVSPGVTYQYPRFTKLAPEAYSSVIVHKGYASLVGDPNNPNRTVLAPISGLPNIPAQSFFELDTEGTITAGDKITSQWSFEKYLLTIRKTDVFITYGDSINNFSTDRTSANRGALSQNHIVQAGRRLFFLAYDGVYEFAGLTTQKISDNVNNFFQTNDLTLMQSGFLFYNPIREVLVCVLPNGATYLQDPLTTTQFIFTWSLEKEAWGRFYWGNTKSGMPPPVDPRYTVLSALFYGGGASPPAVFFSSTTMVEWDNGPDTETDIYAIQLAPNHFGNPFQEKIFDKFYLWAKSLAINSDTGYATPGIYLLLGYNVFNSALLAAGGQVTPDADGFLELFCPGGTWGKSAGPQIRSVYANWATPIQFEMFGLSHWATQEL